MKLEGLFMRKFSGFIVKHRIVILCLMVLLGIVCALMIPRVQINRDQTKYLPDDSAMRAGMALLEEEFPDLETTQTIRVMFTGLDAAQQETVRAQLAALDGVDSVATGSSERYQKDDHTLFVVSTPYAYGSAEETALEREIETSFADYEMVLKNDDSSSVTLPLGILLLALALLLLILIIMCASWFEPVLFVATIAVAVAINLGTNVFLESVSDMTMSIAAILQLVLSMDYSIILMNRYRQEKQSHASNKEAMEAALTHAFSSITSSSVTTIVGLLMLVFMSFKIGKDLGIVLAKGVLCSLLCVFTVLPGLIMLSDKLITRSAKKVRGFSMAGLAGFGCRFRYLLTAGFVVLFIAALLLQNITKMVYSIRIDDPIKEVFPGTNQIVLLYRSDAEEKAAQLAEKLGKTDGVENVINYSTTLGKPCTPAEMTELLDALGTDADLDPALLQMVYYDCYGGDVPELTAGELLRFVAEDVLENETLAAQLDDSLRDQAARLRLLSDPAELTAPKTAAELESLLGIENAEALMMLYFAENGGIGSGTMTLAQFADFLLHDVAEDPAYAAMLEGDVLAQAELLAVLGDSEAVQQGRSYQALASLLGMDEEQARLLYIDYYANSAGYQPAGMTPAAFVAFLQNDIAANPAFASMIDTAALAQLSQLAAFTDPAVVNREMSAAELAALFGIDGAAVERLLSLAYGSAEAERGTMTLPAFTAFLNDTVLADASLSAGMDEATRAQIVSANRLASAAASGEAYTAAGLAALLGMDESLVRQLFVLYFSGMDLSEKTMTLPEFTDYLVTSVLPDPAFAAYFDDASRAQLTMLDSLVKTAASGRSLTAAELAAVTGMEQTAVESIFAAVSTDPAQPMTAMTLPDFLNTVLSEPFSAMIDAAQRAQLQATNQIVQLAAAGQPLGAAQLAAVLGMDESLVRQILILRFSALEMMTLPQFTAFLTGTVLQDPAYAGYFDAETTAQLQQMHQIVAASAAGQQFTSAELAQMFGLDPAQAAQLFALYFGSRIADKTMTPLQFAELLRSDSALTAEMDGAAVQQLAMLQRIMEAAAAGTALSDSEMAALLGMDAAQVRMLYTYHDAASQAGTWRLSLQTVVDYLLNNRARFGDALDDAAFAQLETVQTLIGGTLAGRSYTAEELAAAAGMDAAQLRQLYLLRLLKNGETEDWALPLITLVDFAADDLLYDPAYAAYTEEIPGEKLEAAQSLLHAVLSGDLYAPEEMTTRLAGLTDEISAEQTALLYLYHAGLYDLDPAWKLSVRQLFSHISGSMLSDPRFAGYLNDDLRAAIADADAEIEDAVKQLCGENYSILTLELSLPEESDETLAFMDELTADCQARFGGDYYLIGSVPMSYETAQGFDREMLLITLLTALAIFAVVALTFRSLSIPLILVLIVQCGVYLTVMFSGLLGHSIYYLALLMVQCILMGATIDYGILFTNYYRESRMTAGIRASLTAAYAGATHTILTSGLIMILVTAIISLSGADPTIGQICQTISLGALSATLLILLVLPGLLATFDRFVVKKCTKNDDKSVIS